MLESLLTTESLIALATLTAMEVVLGIDNIIFISILTAKLPPEEQGKVRSTGISLAVGIRLLLLLSISWVMGLTRPLFAVLGHEVTGRALILIAGGMFLIGKATFEIHEKLEGDAHEAEAAGDGAPAARPRAKPGAILAQILVLDIVFSLDSVITAVGMAQQIAVMVVAMLLATGVMLLSAGKVSEFVHRHPTLKILALSFLLLIGMTLVIEGMGGHVSKGYIYFAMAFSLAVELLNMRYRKKAAPVRLREPTV